MSTTHFLLLLFPLSFLTGKGKEHAANVTTIFNDGNSKYIEGQEMM